MSRQKLALIKRQFSSWGSELQHFSWQSLLWAPSKMQKQRYQACQHKVCITVGQASFLFHMNDKFCFFSFLSNKWSAIGKYSSCNLNRYSDQLCESIWQLRKLDKQWTFNMSIGYRLCTERAGGWRFPITGYRRKNGQKHKTVRQLRPLLDTFLFDKNRVKEKWRYWENQTMFSE